MLKAWQFAQCMKRWNRGNLTETQKTVAPWLLYLYAMKMLQAAFPTANCAFQKYCN